MFQAPKGDPRQDETPPTMADSQQFGGLVYVKNTSGLLGTRTQVGGTHYTDMKIQPAAYILANDLGWADGSAIAYLSRWRKKGGIEDLHKAIQTIKLLIEHEDVK